MKCIKRSHKKINIGEKRERERESKTDRHADEMHFRTKFCHSNRGNISYIESKCVHVYGDQDEWYWNWYCVCVYVCARVIVIDSTIYSIQNKKTERFPLIKPKEHKFKAEFCLILP